MGAWTAGWGGGEDDRFDPIDEFNPDVVPPPGPFLSGHELLDGEEHVAFHRVTRSIFDRRGVFDMTFGYNLARLNLDRHHSNAGFRYAIDRARDDELRAEFTPTTPFCPQSHTLAIGSFRAWNLEADAHPYSLVRVRVAPMHHRSEVINDELERLEVSYRRTGALEAEPPLGEYESTRRGDASGGGRDDGISGPGRRR
ncbi:MAG: hypothetical protein ACOC42_04375 [Halobacteriota archaeon]